MTAVRKLVTRYSCPGKIPYRVWEGGVPQRVADVYLDCSIYIYPTKIDADNGERVGGCGFLVQYPLKAADGWSSVYAVTNRHVVNGCKDEVFIRLNPKLGKPEVISTPKDNWISHPNGDDVAVHAIDIKFENFKFAPVPTVLFLTPDKALEEDIGIGDEVFMVGRFINHEGKQQNRPTLRYGHIAMMPSEPIEDAKSGIKQESYLVECRSMGGYSGSPVFVMVMNQAMARRRQTSFANLIPRGPWLLGINWCHLHYASPIKSRSVDGEASMVMTSPPIIENDEYVLSNSGMAGVVPVTKLIELLDSDEVIALRQKDEEAVRKKLAESSYVSLDTAQRPAITQTTAEGHEIPIPTRDQFIDDLKKASRKKD